MKLSVIIPTLGGIQLKDTIKALQNSSIQPLEILICIPNSSKLVENIDLSDNIKILRTKKKGQVYQRMIGFLAAKGEFVLQIDDDIVLEKDSIEKLLDCFDSLVGRVAIAPKYVWKGTNISVFPGSHDTLTQKFSDWIMNGKIGYKPGAVSLSGVGFGLDFNDKTQDKNQSEWLPGGCVLHRLQDVITLDYFPFSGKAYSEDLIHSYLLRGNGLKLYVCNSAIAYMEPIFYRDSLIELYRQYKATRYVANLQGKGFVRLHLLYFMRLFKMIVRVVTKTIRSFI
jgi:glycosyltransferase involved in cell wall biosynthesis